MHGRHHTGDRLTTSLVLYLVVVAGVGVGVDQGSSDPKGFHREIRTPHVAPFLRAVLSTLAIDPPGGAAQSPHADPKALCRALQRATYVRRLTPWGLIRKPAIYSTALAALAGTPASM